MTKQKQYAAQLVAKNKTSVEIAKACGVSDRTVFTWKADKEFQAEVARVREAWREKARSKGPADPDYRLRVLADLVNRFRTAIAERGADETNSGIPGHKTGVVSVTYKMQAIGDGESTAIPEYSIDTAGSAEIRALLIQAATEVGDWKTRSVVEQKKTSTADATPAAILLAMLLTDAQIDELEKKALALAAAEGA